MSESPARFYLTTPIYYVNARPHIGHAYTTIVADVLARRSRSQGADTWFLTGTDEHGQKIERSAAAAGIPPQAFTDAVSAEFKQLWDRMGLTYDQYIRTTDEAHKRGVQKLWRELESRGHIYLSSYTGQYCVSEEIFVEGPPGTLGPDGRPTETVTEENYFFRLSNFQLPLINLIESDTLEVTPLARKNELLSFLRGPVHQPSRPGPIPTLVHPFDSGEPIGPSDVPFNSSEEPAPTDSAPGAPPAPGQLAYSRLGHPYLPGNLRDLSISRSSFTWGIPVPDDPKHVIYVWLDALANYLTAVGYGDDSPEAQARLARLWPADLHLVGKEIIRQHCIYWPAFLLAAGLPLPKKVTAHGWLLFEDSKMSKSKGNIVRTETILDAFGTLCPPSLATTGTATGAPHLASEMWGTRPLYSPQEALSKAGSSRPQPAELNLPKEAASDPAIPTPHQRDLFAADILRYFLLREIPFGQDGSFSFDALITRYNADLANGYGNLVSRTLNMISQYFNGSVPLPGPGPQPPEGWNVVAEFGRKILRCEFSSALQDTTFLITSIDGLISSSKPWLLAKSESPEDREKLASVLASAWDGIRILTALLYPILPYATTAVWRQLGLGEIEDAAKRGDLQNLTWGGLRPGTKLGNLSPIFPRADKGLAQIMTDMETQKTEAAQSLTGQRHEAPAPDPTDPTHPAAPPRTAALPESNPGAQVAASAAHTTERPGTPPHTEAASGIFAAQKSEQIAIDDFAKIDLRVAQIVVAERIPKADKLLRLEVDLGYEKRQILSGIAEWYTPEELLGRRIVIIANLAPRKMRGLESHGMLLAASAEGEKPGKPHLATFTGADDLPLGSRLR